MREVIGDDQLERLGDEQHDEVQLQPAAQQTLLDVPMVEVVVRLVGLCTVDVLSRALPHALVRAGCWRPRVLAHLCAQIPSYFSRWQPRRGQAPGAESILNHLAQCSYQCSGVQAVVASLLAGFAALRR